MTITEFLLARIAEDEDRADLVKSRQADDPQPISDGYGWWQEYDLLYVPPARVLAECQSKRAIVERYAHLAEHGDSGDARWVLRHLAAVYADHPDYREEWRP